MPHSGGVTLRTYLAPIMVRKNQAQQGGHDQDPSGDADEVSPETDRAWSGSHGDRRAGPHTRGRRGELSGQRRELTHTLGASVTSPRV